MPRLHLRTLMQMPVKVIKRTSKRHLVMAMSKTKIKMKNGKLPQML